MGIINCTSAIDVGYYNAYSNINKSKKMVRAQAVSLVFA